MTRCVCDPTGFLEPITGEALKARVAALEQTCAGLPAAPKKGEQSEAHLSNQRPANTSGGVPHA